MADDIHPAICIFRGIFMERGRTSILGYGLDEKYN